MYRTTLDRLVGWVTAGFALFSGIILLLLVVGLLARSEQVLSTDSLSQLLFSSVWKPSRGEFGFYPFIASTVVVTAFAMLFSVPVCLMSAIYLTEYSGSGVRSVFKAGADTLAGIPSVIFGLWGVLFIVPFVRDYVAPAFGVETTGYCILSGSLVLAIMVIPIMLSIMEDMILSVPEDLKEASYTLGATKWQTIKHVIIPKTAHGLFSAVILGFSRAFGETMAVLMVVGNVATHTKTVFDPAYPLTALIANNYGEMLSIPLYESALMFGALLLLVIVVVFSLIARTILARMQSEAY